MSLDDGQRALLQGAIEAGLQEGGRRLARLTRRDWDVRATSFQDGPASSLKGWMAGGFTPHVGALLPLQGGGRLAVLVLFPAKSASLLAKAFTAGLKSRKPEELETQALGEIANIIAHAASGSVADAVKGRILLSAPMVKKGAKLELLESAVSSLKASSLSVLLSVIGLSSSDALAECSLAILVDDELLARWLKDAPRPA